MDTREWIEITKQQMDLLEKSMREQMMLYSQIMALARKSDSLKTSYIRYMQSKQRNKERDV